MLFDGHCMRDMWRSGENARNVLRDELTKDGARWLMADSDIAYNDDDLESHLKRKVNCGQKEYQAHHEHLADIAVDFDLDEDEIEMFEPDYVAVATSLQLGVPLITSSETSGGRKRLQIAAIVGGIASCWKDHFDI